MGYQEFKSKYNINLNQQQEEAVQTLQGLVLLLAVPGSGKTTVIVNRLGYMIYDQGISPKKILTVTYTVSATNDMKQRFYQVFGDEYNHQLEFRTINGLSQKILNYCGNLMGKKAYPIIENSRKNFITKKIFEEVVGTFSTELDIKNIALAITYVKNMRLSVEEIDDFEWEIKEFPLIYQKYEKELKSCKLMDYDDQMVYALACLEKFPQVLAYFQHEYEYLCMDEAQDTSKLQHDMIKLLVSKWGNLFMVGDEDQSIYGFRAAYPEALVYFEQEHRGATILLMESNYRSCEEIVNTADKFIQQNQSRHKKQIHATRPKGGVVKQIELQTRSAQYPYLLNVARENQEEIAILYRNNESVLPLINQLEHHGINYQMKSNEMTFFTHATIVDMAAYIRLALEPNHVDSFFRIYYKLGIGMSKLVATTVVNNHNGTNALLEDVERLTGIPDYLRKRCRSMNILFKKIRGCNAGGAIYQILHHMGYLGYMQEHGIDSGKTEILQMLANQEKQVEDLVLRLDYLKEVVTNGKSDSDTKFILSTIHSSKGLEYDSVYLLDMVEGILPSISQPYHKDANPADIALYEEERRLYYVAMTRAKNQLYIFSYKGNITSSFSKFIFEKKAVSGTKSRTMTKEEIASHLQEFEEGVIVYHKKYGEGSVVIRKGHVAEIYFYHQETMRVISLDVAIEKNIIQIKQVEKNEEA